MIRASKSYIDRLEKEEGYKALNPKHLSVGDDDKYGWYKDENGKWTIGFGATDPTIDPKLIARSYKAARQQLEIDVRKKEKIGNRIITRKKPFTQPQQNVIVDILFNLRLPPKRMSAFKKVMNEGSDDSIKAWIGQFKGIEVAQPDGSKKLSVLPGLVKRRAWRLGEWDSEKSIGTEDLVPEPEQDTKFERPASRERPNSFSIEDQEELDDLQDFTTEQEDDDLFDSLPNDINPNLTPEEIRESEDKEIDGIENDEAQEELAAQPDFSVEDSPQGEEEIFSALPEDLRVPTERETQHRQSKEDSEDKKFDNNASLMGGMNQATNGLFLDDVKKANTFKKRYKTPLSQGTFLAQTDEFNSFHNKQENKKIAAQHPALAKFSLKPENFLIMGKEFEDLREIDVSAVSMSDTKITVRRELSELMKGFTHLQIGMGIKASDLGSREIDEITETQSTLPLLKKRRALSKLQRELKESSFEIDNLSLLLKDFSVNSVFDIIPEIGAIMNQAGHSVSETMDVIKTMVDDKEAAALLMLGSSVNGIIPTIGGAATAALGATLGAVSPIPLGARTGALRGWALGSGIFGALTAYMTRMNELMSETGYSDNAAGFYDDPQRTAAAQKIATKYAAYMGVFEFILSEFTGTFTAKNIAARKAAKAIGVEVTAGQAAKSAAGAFAKDFSLQFFSEGPKETLSRALPGPGVPGDPVSKAVSQGVEEQLLGFPVSVAQTAAGAAFHTLVGSPTKRFFDNQSTKKKVKTITDEVVKSSNAMNWRNGFKKLQKAFSDSGKANQFPEQVGELIDEAASVNENGTPVEGTPDINYEQETTKKDGKLRKDDIENFLGDSVETQQKVNDEESSNNTVRLRPSELEALMDSRGINPESALSGLGPQVLEDYQRARQDNEDLVLTMSEFTRLAALDDELADIARGGDNEHNAKEAKPRLDAAEDEFKKLFNVSEDDGGKDSNEPPTFKFGDSDKNTISMLEVTTRHRGRDDRKVMKLIRKGIVKAASGNKNITKPKIDLMTEVQYRHVQHRSIVMGLPILDIVKALKFSQDTKERMGVVEGVVRYKNPENILLTLREDTDVATLIHEFAHTWLYDAMFDWEPLFAIKEEDLTHEQGIYKTALKELAEELGLETLHELRFLDTKDALGKEKFDRAQETFAQTAEKYFLDGTFKNSRIKHFMEVFRSWLLPIAEKVGEAYRKTFPALKVTPKIERIFEGVIGVSESVDEQMFSLFDDPLFGTEDLDGRDIESYRADYAKARATIFQDIVANSVNKSFRERQRLIDRAMKEIQKQAERTVDAMPAQVIAKELSGRKGADKISRKSFESLFGNDVLSTIPKGIVGGIRKAGLEAVTVMGNQMITNPAEFLEILQEAGRRDDFIKQEVDRRVDQDFPVTKSDEEIKQAAIDSISKDKAIEKFYLREMKELENKALRIAGKELILPPETKKRMNIQRLRDIAQSKVDTSFLLRFKPAKFAKEANRFGKDAAMLFRQGDIVGALEAKQRQVLYRIAQGIAFEASSDMAKTQSLFKLIKKMTPRQIGYRFYFEGFTFAKMIVQAYEANLPLPKLTREAISEGSRIVYTDNFIDDINSRIEVLSGPEGVLNAFVLRGPQTTQVQTFKELGNIVKALTHAAQDSKMVVVGNDIIDLDTLAAEIRSEVGGVRPTDPKNRIQRDSDDRIFKNFKGSKEKFRSMLFGLFSSNEEYAKTQLARVVNSFLENESAFVSEKEDIVAALTTHLATRTKAKGGSRFEKWIVPVAKRAPFLQDAVEKIQNLPSKDGSKLDKIKNLAERVESNVLTGDIINMSNLKITMSREQLMIALLLSGSESGLSKLLLGGIGDSGTLAVFNELNLIDDTAWKADIDQLISDKVLIKEDFDFIEGVWDTLKDLHGPATKAFAAVNGYPFGEIQPRELKTPWKTYKGGYFPTKAQASFTDLSTFDIFSGDSFMELSQELYGGTNVAFTKRRTGKIAPLELSFGTIPKIIHFTLQLKHLYEPMHQLTKVLNHTDVRESLEARRPGVYDNIIVPWVERTKNQQYTTSVGKNQPLLRGLSKMADTLRRVARVEWFLGKFASAGKQYFGLVQATSRVDMQNLFDGTRIFMADMEGTTSQIEALAPRMKTRFKNDLIRIKQSHNDIDMVGDWVSNAAGTVDKASFYMIQVTQTHTDKIVWVGAFKQGRDKGLTVKQASDFATNTVEETQATSMISARSELEQQTGFIRLFTDFTTIPLTMYHLNLTTYIQNLDQDAQVRARRQLGVAAATVVMPVMLLSSVSALFNITLGGEDDEDFLEDMMKRMAMEAIDIGAPFVGRNAVAIASQFTTSPSEIRPSPAFDMLGSIGRAGAASRDIFNGVQPTDSGLSSIFTAFTLMTGIPTPFTNEIIKLKSLMKTKEQKKKESRNRSRARRKIRKREKRK